MTTLEELKSQNPSDTPEQLLVKWRGLTVVNGRTMSPSRQRVEIAKVLLTDLFMNPNATGLVLLTAKADRSQSQANSERG